MRKPITIGIAKAVLQQELEPGRFEEFCCVLLSAVEGGHPILPTSRSWDRGRDGRSVGMGDRILLCATLDPDIDPKATADIQKIATSGFRAHKVYYCTTQSLSEHSLDSIGARLSKMLGGKAIVEALDVRQLARLSRQFPNALWHHYASEVKDCIAALESDDGPDASRATLLALSTACHPNSGAIRDAAYQSILLRIFSDKKTRTVNECCRDLSATLKLSRSLAPTPIEYHLEVLRETEHLKYDGKRYSISDAGAVKVESDSEAAAAELLEGRRLIREHIEKALGTPLAAQQYDEIWNAMQSRLTRFFYEEGQRMVSTINRFTRASMDSEKTTESSLPFFVEHLASAAASTCSQKEFAGQVSRAIIDMFEERQGVAHEWLSRLCATFVLVCTLGLEATSGGKIEDTIAKTHLILDTDIVLELLGEGEPGHASAQQLVSRWRSLGGTLLLAEPVAEEVAHHAWIAEMDYQEGRQFLEKEIDRCRFLRNVFTRSFGYLLEKGQATKNDWRRYIGSFRGRSSSDAAPIKQYVSENYTIKRLPDADISTSPGREAWECLEQRALGAGLSGRDLHIKLDKARRDARLFASMNRYADAMRESSGDGSCILVTSSGRLRELHNRLGTSYDLSLSLADSIYLLTMVPGVTMGLSALRSILFDGRVLHRGSDFDLLVLRAVRDSDEYDLPWVQRSALTNTVRKRMVQVAKERGDTRLMPDEAAHNEDEEVKQTLTASIAEALSAMGARTRTEQQLDEARRRVAELERKLAQRK